MSDAAPPASLSPLGLQSIAVQAFRCLRNTGPLPFRADMTVLAGENGGGKSSFLDAIEFLISGISIEADDRTHGAEGEEIVVEGVFASLDRVCADILSVRARQAYGSTRVMEVRDWIHPAFGTRPDQMNVLPLKASLQAIGVPIPKAALKVDLVALADTWIAVQPKDDLTAIWRLTTAEERTRLPRVSRFSAAEANGPMSVVQNLITREARRLVAEPRFLRQLDQVAADLDRAIQPSLDLIRQTIEQHCPELESVDIGATFDFSKVSPVATWNFSLRQMQLSIGKLGQGRLRRIAIAVHEANARIMANEEARSTEILLYDEPDSHLDVASQRRMFDILVRQAVLAHVQVAVGTHSKNLIDLVPLPALLHFALDETSSTTVTTVAGTSYEEDLAFHASLYASLGLRNSVVLDERRFLLVEGATEQAAIPILFQHYAERSLASFGVHLINTEGSVAMRQFAVMLRQQWRRDLILLSDADQRAEHEKWMDQADLQEDESVFFIGDQEFEDAFSDTLWSAVLQASFACRDPEQRWIEGDIARFRTQGGKFSAALKDGVSRRWRRGIVSKPDLGQALASACPRNEIPPVLRACFDRIIKPAPVTAGNELGDRAVNRGGTIAASESWRQLLPDGRAPDSWHR